MKNKQVQINGNVYLMGNKMANNCLELAKQKYRNENHNAIYGVEKDFYIEMKNDVYESIEAMNKVLEEYRKAGYKTYCTYKQVK